MRVCAKMRCEAEPVAAMSLRYDEREVVIGSVGDVRDPGLVELCRQHAGRITPPIGWTIRDLRPALVG